MRPVRYSINVTLDGCCDHRVMITYQMMEAGWRTPALAELGLIDEYEFIVHPRLAGDGPTLFAGLSTLADLTLAGRTEFGSGAVAMRYEPKR